MDSFSLFISVTSFLLLYRKLLEYFGHLLWNSWLIGKGPDAWKAWGQEENEITENEMVEWHHQFSRHEFEQTLRDNEGQGSLTCCSPWGHKESDNWTTTKSKKTRGALLWFCFLMRQKLFLKAIQFWIFLCFIYFFYFVGV